MRHGDKVKKLSRNTSHRRALLRNMTVSLFKYENIVTTVQKAKVLRSYAEKVITKAKNAILKSEEILADKKNKDAEKEAAIVLMNAKRLVSKDMKDRKILAKLFDDIALRYKKRDGGYTRIIRIGMRTSDAAERAFIELVEE